MKAILTGGLGFIGYNFYDLFKDGVEFLVVDKRSYASNPYAEKNISNLVVLDISNPRINGLVEEFAPDVIFHFAAESHVDRSIIDASAFVRSNVVGTCQLLEATKQFVERHPDRSVRFVHVSTDEVYGSLGEDGAFVEETPLAPNSPYSASKAASDCFVRAYHETHKLDTVTTRCSNNYGPWQFPEKLIPLMICQALDEKPLPVYGKGQNVRDWIYVEDHCRGVMAAALKGKSGEVYNFGGRAERANIDVVKNILSLLGKNEGLIQFVADRKGHDFRYAMDCAKAERELGWRPELSFDEGLARTVKWCVDNREWLDFVRSDTYQEYYRKNYQQRESTRVREQT
jgi:dTDP-glucose 4,6-dehydratase